VSTVRQRLHVDPAAAATAFGVGPLALRHGVTEEQGFGAAALVEVAARIPASWVTGYVSRDQVLDRNLVRIEAPARELVSGIATNGVRLTLYHVEHVSPYRELLHDHLDGWEAMTGEREGGTTKRTANVFLGAPGAIVPAHFDRHHNVLLQVRGTKTLTVGWFADAARTRRETEREFDQGHHGIADLPPETVTFELGPGDGVYIPAYAFHWVVGGPEVSVALSCGWSTATTQRAEEVHQANARLRRLGIPTRPPGRSATVDASKALLFRSAQRLHAVRQRTRAEA
jgi:hypothetical protein